MNEQTVLDFGVNEYYQTPSLVAFTGLSKSGKDSASKFFIKEKGYIKIAFSDPMYAMMKVLVVDFMGQDPKYLTDAHKNDFLPFFGHMNISVRYLLQTLGTEWGRKLIDPAIWIKIAMKRVEDLNASIVISDCRFDNEAEYIKARGGKILKIERPHLAKMNHVSENGISEKYIDDIIPNDGTLDEFKDRVFKSVEEK